MVIPLRMAYLNERILMHQFVTFRTDHFQTQTFTVLRRTTSNHLVL